MFEFKTAVTGHTISRLYSKNHNDITTALMTIIDCRRKAFCCDFTVSCRERRSLLRCHGSVKGPQSMSVRLQPMTSFYTAHGPLKIRYVTGHTCQKSEDAGMGC